VRPESPKKSLVCSGEIMNNVRHSRRELRPEKMISGFATIRKQVYAEVVDTRAFLVTHPVVPKLTVSIYQYLGNASPNIGALLVDCSSVASS